VPATEYAVGLTATAARAAAGKKAEHLVAVDVSERLGLTDVFLLASGLNHRHVHAIVDAIDEAMHRAGARRRTREGFADAHWVLVDYGDVVVHVLLNEDREFYSLERLWKDCPTIELPKDLVEQHGGEGEGEGRPEGTESS
jgi:iojap-like protein